MGKKDRSYFQGVCDIIMACKDGDVLELHMGELSIFRTNDANYFAFANRNPKANPWEGQGKGDQRSSGGSQPTSPTEKDAFEVQELLAAEERDANLPLEDPVAYEKMMFDSLDKKGAVIDGLTAEQVADMDEEETPL